MPPFLQRILTLAFRVLTLVSPALAGRVAFRLFTTPIGARRVQIQGRRLQDARRVQAEARQENHAGVAVYVWESGDEEKTAILIHGWTSMALYMTGFVAPLRAAGYRVVAFDFPAHGASSGRRLTFDRAGTLVVDLADRFGEAVLIGHSFGASMAVLAAAGAPTLAPSPAVRALVLVAGANRLEDVTQRFADTFALTDAVKRRIDARLEALGGDAMDRFTSVEGIRRSSLPALLIHDRDDRVVPVEDSRTVAAETHAVLWESERLGHNRVLYAGTVHECIVDFLAREITTSEAAA